MFAKCYDKSGKLVNHYSYVIKVNFDKKYNFFEFHQKIYHHEIIFVKRPDEMEYVELYENIGDKKPIKVVTKDE